MFTSARLPPPGPFRAPHRPPPTPRPGLRLVAVLVGLVATSALRAAPPGSGVDFHREVRPLLAENCFACHGPDAAERKAKLRLDDRRAALEWSRRGRHAIVPSDPSSSALWERVSADEEDRRMPPPESGKSLSSQERETIRRWIEEGASWEEHWSFVPPRRETPPEPANTGWARNPVDRFVLARLEAEGISPSPEADRATLARRLSFDLIGLPPDLDALDAFLADGRPDAYERFVESLLESPHHGERLAIFWLDLVRFADTRGYHSDNPRNVHPYRDYVIRSFRENKPFDVFTREQLAGDLLPDATISQRVATCYTKLNQTTEEGGAQPREYEVMNAADRVRNVSAVWLGATLGCAQCHDHKFDPFSARDFYAMAAFFADIEEAPIMDRDPGILVPDDEESARLESLEIEIGLARAALDAPGEALARELDEAERAWEDSLASRDGLPDKVRAALDTPRDERADADRALVRSHYRSTAPLLEAQRAALAGLEKEKADLEKRIARCIVAKSGAPRTVRILHRGNWMDTSGEVVQPAIPAYFGALDLTSGGAGDDPSTPRRATREDLAAWIVSPSNPLTARVLVNRVWKLFFGAGLSRRLEDLGAMGEPPSHPRLLDWLAVELVDSGWDLRSTVRTLVTSSVYRQSSVPRDDLLARDPYNRLLARQQRWRHDAEIVRDNALAISGLLVPEVGGESVKPYQPEGYWVHLNFPKRDWKADAGENQYRRGIYTWWQRSFLHPAMLAFDAPSREECTAERPRSNIPQQALVVLNDESFVEAARVFARRDLMEATDGAGPSPLERIVRAFRRATSRRPDLDELVLLVNLYEQHREHYRGDLDAARELLSVGQSPVDEDADPAELAAWTSVARALLNLHETLTRN